MHPYIYSLYRDRTAVTNSYCLGITIGRTIATANLGSFFLATPAVSGSSSTEEEDYTDTCGPVGGTHES